MYIRMKKETKRIENVVGGGLVPEHIRQTLNELWTLNGIFAFLYLHRVICFLLTEKGNDNKYDHFIFQQDSATI